MLTTTYYFQDCPICGRSLRILVEYLGQQVVCRHCQGRFDAYDPSNSFHSLNGHHATLMRKVEALLTRQC